MSATSKVKSNSDVLFHSFQVSEMPLSIDSRTNQNINFLYFENRLSEMLCFVNVITPLNIGESEIGYYSDNLPDSVWDIKFCNGSILKYYSKVKKSTILEEDEFKNDDMIRLFIIEEGNNLGKLNKAYFLNMIYRSTSISIENEIENYFIFEKFLLGSGKKLRRGTVTIVQSKKGDQSGSNQIN